jgi:hypothetical protein
MSAVRWLVPVFASLLVGACGTYVPEIQEVSNLSETGQVLSVGTSQLLVQAIVDSIHCELRNAVTNVIDEDKSVAKLNPGGRRSAAWLDKWVAQIGLTLTVEEKTSLNPAVLWSPLSPITSVFTLAGGGTLSSDATRIDKLGYLYTVRELYALGECPKDRIVQNSKAPTGSLLIQSDLKLREWLFDQVFNVATGEYSVPTAITTPLKQNVLSHEVKFEVVTTGTLTPAWKLTRVTFNQTGTLFSATRDRTHDLVITFGPIDPATKGLAGPAAAEYLASRIGSALGDNVKLTP